MKHLAFFIFATGMAIACRADFWLEAEGFADCGGWTIDQQAWPQMGSAYVMAHGLGKPIADAITECNVPAAGEYTAWVRTRDWTAPWKRGTPAGRFQLLVNGSALPAVLGTNGAEWNWQKAGTVKLEKGNAVVALHDLTGFDGRADAIFFTTAKDLVPEADTKKLEAFRRKAMGLPVGTAIPDDPLGEFDLVIAGGGVAGTCMAFAAIKCGAKVALIQDRPVLGGCNSSEVRVGAGGTVKIGPYPAIGNVVQAVTPIFGDGGTYDASFYEDQRKRNAFLLLDSNRYRLALNTRVYGVETASNDPARITAYLARNAKTGKDTRFRGKLFADCTGDAAIARILGCETMYGREERSRFNEGLAPVKATRQVMGLSVCWLTKNMGHPVDFPDVDWGIAFNENNCYYVQQGDWEQESGFNLDMANGAEYIRDYSMMCTYANWSYVKNHSARKAQFKNLALDWMSAVGGKRESYRVVGDIVLTQGDIEGNIPYPDATAAMDWSLDLHFPDPQNSGKFAEPFRSCAYHRGLAQPYPVPYRCLYARDAKNLFLGGRDISVSHVAFSAVRVMRTLGALGEVAGMAAALAAKTHSTPRGVYENHLEDLKIMLRKGITIPTPHGGGAGSRWESYHFKDLGWYRLGVTDSKEKILSEAEKKRKEEMEERIRHLDVQTIEMEKNSAKQKQ